MLPSETLDFIGDVFRLVGGDLSEGEVSERWLRLSVEGSDGLSTIGCMASNSSEVQVVRGEMIDAIESLEKIEMVERVRSRERVIAVLEHWSMFFATLMGF